MNEAALEHVLDVFLPEDPDAAAAAARGTVTAGGVRIVMRLRAVDSHIAARGQYQMRAC